MKRPPRWPLAAALLAAALAAQAEGVRTPSMLANTCAGCHGTNGASAGEYMPTIAGMDNGYLYGVMSDYKSGARRSTIMGRIMKGYTEQEIHAIAGFYAAQPWTSAARAATQAKAVKKGQAIHESSARPAMMTAGASRTTSPRAWPGSGPAIPAMPWTPVAVRGIGASRARWANGSRSSPTRRSRPWPVSTRARSEGTAMTGTTRRTFLKASTAVAAASALGLPALLRADTPKARVVVIGGGYGGTIAAKYIQMADPNIQVTLIEKEAAYVSCPLSNEVLGGERDIKTLTFAYKGLAKRGITVVQDEVVGIDPVKREVQGKGKAVYPYDKLVVSPGVSFRWDAIKGMSEAAAQTIPHAWKAGPQTLLLKKQLAAMRNGGTCIIVAPPNPFRCPPGPYERAAQIAFYFKRHKPKSKVLVLDAKDAFSKQGLFVEGWKRNYGDMIEWVGAAAGGAVEAIDVKKRVLTGTVEEYKGDVINLIPAQKAADLAQVAGSGGRLRLVPGGSEDLRVHPAQGHLCHR